MKRNHALNALLKLILFVIGLLFSFIALLFYFNFAPIHEFVIKTAMVIEPGSEAYNAWLTNDPPLIMDLYFFNWTNPLDVYEPKIKPNFQQVGPYRFLEVKEKYNVVFHKNDTVSYEYVKKYYFMEDESPRPLTDVINTVNPVALTAAYRMRFAPFWTKVGLSFSISTTSRVHITKTIDELLFSGYEDKLLNIIRGVAPFLNVNGEIDEKFGFFYKRNCTYGINGYFSMYTGHDRNFGKMLEYNFSNRTNFYEGRCGEIRGSAGEFYPLNTKRDRIELFSNEMCSTQVFEYENDVTVKGVRGYKFSSKSLFDNGTVHEENSCFCNGECIPNGVLNISSCRMDAPIYLSLPHFFNADPYYTNIIDGLTPNKDEHDFYITLEPKSSIVIDIGARMQLNMLLQPLDGFSIYRNVPKIYVPIFYFDQVLPMSDDLAVSVGLIQNLPSFGETAAYVFFILGVLLLVGTIAMSLYPLVPNRTSKETIKNGIGVPVATTASHDYEMRCEEFPLKLKT